MINFDHIKLLDSYVDESGGSSIGESRYKYFSISAVLMNPTEKELANLLFSKWRTKYLMDADKCFHAADYFEGYKRNYRKAELRIPKNFNKSIEDLLEILHHINFKAEVFYVDLPRLRRRYLLNEPPAYKTTFANIAEQQQYKQTVKQYEDSIVRTVGEKKKFLPLTLVLKNAFTYHNVSMTSLHTTDAHNRIVKGYLNFESLSGADTLLIANYHRLKGKVSTDYEDKIIGLNFHTKNSLDAGIELADLIAYISFQNLRFKRRLINEYRNISPEVILQIRHLRKVMREKHKIQLNDVTDNTV